MNLAAPASPTAASATGAPDLTPDRLAALRAAVDADPAARAMQNAVTSVGVDQVALDRSVLTSTDHTFSNRLDDWKCTNQKKSGRCWCFAGLNLLRAGAMKAMNLKDFEFSQNWTLFWDKLERANYFLEAIIETAGRDVDDRTVAHLLERPLEDGGQWNMFVNVVRKHGLVPQSAMPETESSSNTAPMNRSLITTLRRAAARLRAAHEAGTSLDDLRAIKHDALEIVHRILCIHLGTPPAEIDWQWEDKDRKFHRDGRMTPARFAAKYVTIPLDEYVCLVHDPRPTSPVGRTFTVEYLGNVVGGERVKYLNVDVAMMKEIAMRTILDGEPVWFGCDVGKMMERKQGVWDARLFDFEGVYGASLEMTKAERLLYHETKMTHAMLFTGVDVVDDSPRRWRVENSWGDQNGCKGFYVMNDSWFDEHMFEIAARKSYLPAELQAALDEEPIVLPAWDPMGALAR